MNKKRGKNDLDFQFESLVNVVLFIKYVMQGDLQVYEKWKFECVEFEVFVGVIFSRYCIK